MVCQFRFFLSIFCLFALPHFFEFTYAICVEGYVRGRYPLRSSLKRTLKMKARVEGRLFMQCTTTRCTVLLSIETITVSRQ